MNSTLFKLGIFSVATATVFTACKNSTSGGGFETDKETGVQYQYVKHDEKGARPVIGDYATVKMIFKGASPSNPDTEFFNTMKRRNPRDTSGAITIPLQKGFSGCLEQGITMMAAGDSALFKISADSLYLKTFRGKEVPKYVKAGSMLTFYVKLVTFKTQQQMQQEQQAEMAKRQQEAEQRKGMEAGMIAKYLADNHYANIKPTADSLFILERKGGKGKEIKEGDSIYVTYAGTLLNGKPFDDSERHGGPLKLLYKKDMQLIKGWVEMLGTMHEGESAKILVPSSIGYGNHQMGPDILPYSPMHFELTVVKVFSGK